MLLFLVAVVLFHSRHVTNLKSYSLIHLLCFTFLVVVWLSLCIVVSRRSFVSGCIYIVLITLCLLFSTQSTFFLKINCSASEFTFEFYIKHARALRSHSALTTPVVTRTIIAPQTQITLQEKLYPYG